MIAQRRAGGKERKKDMEEKEKTCDPVERIRRGLTGNFGRGSAELKLQYEGVSNPGAPEGDQTNVRLDWGESGPELIGPEDITSVDQLKDGHLVETARAAVKQITRLDYAIAGVRSKIASIGIKFTDKDLSRDEIGFLIAQLNALQADLFELEEERERKLRGTVDVEVKDRDS